MDGPTSTWLNQLQQPTLVPFSLLYGEKIPDDVRNHIGNWIQSQFIHAAAYPDKQNATKDIYEDAAKFLNKLIDKLRRISALYENDIKSELDDSACILLQLFSHNPVPLYQQLINCLQQHPFYCITLDAIVKTKVSKELLQLKVMVNENEKDNIDLIIEHGFLAQGISELQSIQAAVNVAQMGQERMHTQCQLIHQQKIVKDHLRTFSNMQFAMANGLRKSIDKTDKLQNKILNKYLTQWKINQRLAAIGAPAKLGSDLDTIQSWCESLMEIILSMKEQIVQAIKIKSEGYIDLSTDPVLTQALKDVTGLMETLIYNSFIVEQQPPQVLRRYSRFAASVRLLTGKTLCNQMNPPQVSVSIITESQAQQAHCMNETTPSAAGEISDNIGLMKFNGTTKQLSAVFNKLCIKKITRVRGRQCVLDEKLALLFQAKITTEHANLVHPVWTVSCPVVVIVHVLQEQRSCATITWDNVFTINIRSPYGVPELVQWNRLADVLNLKFCGSSGHPLSPEHIHFLCEKALGSNKPFPIPNDLIITWSQFCKDDLPGRNYTFWGWFYQAMKLTRDHFQDLWLQGRIYGFIEKGKTEQYLANCKPGTFLVRFSGTVLGAITIGFVHENNIGQRQILHIEPFTAKDLSIRSLADRILDIEGLTHLYPNIPKHEAFKRQNVRNFYPSRQKTNYIGTELRTTLIFPPVAKSSNESCNNDQAPVMSEYTCTNSDNMSFFDLETITLLPQQF
uniref:Signal transducer and activator of transcription n=1 Tax=Anopheles maculatus TaxID=74869 RepID=A0A182SDR0_9DIPT|nr:TPA_inf: signal transducer and activator of transcription B [Anopheles maculatus]